MNETEVYSSEFIKIIKKEDGYYIESYKKGLTVPVFNKLLAEHPEMRISNFTVLKEALVFAPQHPKKFADISEKIKLEVAEDELEAYLTVCVNPEEIEGDQKTKLIFEVFSELSKKNIVYGIKKDVLMNNLENNKKILIAEGRAAVNGKDSESIVYEMKDVKPEATETGNVDHYELNLINSVKRGDWLGERTDPTEGTPGKTVKGSLILPMKGKLYPLLYDRKTVYEKYENNKTTLYALRDGAVHFEGEKISVSNHLEIKNNVDFETGNIDFDGFLTVQGTVEDNFSVSADKDIEILGEYGVGSAKDIISRGGSIFIRGGIAGKNRAVIRSNKDIYTKFVADADIICEGSVHIGFYSLNSNIKAKEVILDSPKGRIIGGSVEAEIKVVTAILGAPSEKRTLIKVTGFDRDELKKALENNVNDIKELKDRLSAKKQEITVYNSLSTLTPDKAAEFEKVSDEFGEIKDALKDKEREQKNIANYLRTKGEGEIRIGKMAYPNVVLEMKRKIKEIQEPINNTSYYISQNEIIDY